MRSFLCRKCPCYSRNTSSSSVSKGSPRMFPVREQVRKGLPGDSHFMPNAGRGLLLIIVFPERSEPDSFHIQRPMTSSASSTVVAFGFMIATGTSTIFSTIDASIGAQIIPAAPSFSAMTAAMMHSSMELAVYPRILIDLLPDGDLMTLHLVEEELCRNDRNEYRQFRLQHPDDLFYRREPDVHFAGT